jgi:uncharacterized protein YndB with AHSA1/START domain
MEPINTAKITVEVLVKASLEIAWKHWTSPESILRWNHASDDWHTTKVSNDLRVGGTFSSRMEAKDGNFGFDFYGVYDEIIQGKKISYTLGDGRKVQVVFSSSGDHTKVVETFEAESTNTLELQRGGWQAIMDNYKKLAETEQ